MRIKKTLSYILPDTNSQGHCASETVRNKASESDFAKIPFVPCVVGCKGSQRSPSAPLLDKVHVVGIFLEIEHKEKNKKGG